MLQVGSKMFPEGRTLDAWLLAKGLLEDDRIVRVLNSLVD